MYAKFRKPESHLAFIGGFLLLESGCSVAWGVGVLLVLNR